MSQNKIKINNIRNYFISLLAFVLPLNKNIVPLIIVMIIILWIVEGHWHQKWSALKNIPFFVAISLYVWHLIGMFYTNNLKIGAFDLEQKLSLVIFPILFFTYSDSQIQSFRFIFKYFIWGCFLAGCICFANAFYKYYNFNDIDVFYYGQFSAIMHTSYFSMYLCAAIIFLLFQPETINNHFFRIGLISFFTLCVVFVSSKSGIIALLLIGLCKIFAELLIIKSWSKTIMLAVLFIAFIAGFSIFFPKSAIRLQRIKKDIFESGQEINTTASRIVIWKHAAKLIKQHFIFGVGTGDLKDALKSSYLEKGEEKLAEKQLNAHNQYLQLFVALGVIGLILLIVNISAVFLKTFNSKHIDGVLLTLLIAFNFLFESMLETQAGVVFIAFFLSFYFRLSSQKSLIKSSIIAT